MIRQAAGFAKQAHEGKMRKGTAVPYIVHPMDTGVIVSRMTDDPEVISAALLHDVIEDAGVTKEELEERFGSRVAELVAAESEDKTRTWKERKQATIDRLTDAGRDVKMICLADKLSNLRSTAADYLLKGDEVWKKFRVTDKREHEWYYRGVFAKLSELSGESAYGEYRELMEMLFGQKENSKKEEKGNKLYVLDQDEKKDFCPGGGCFLGGRNGKL